MLDNCTDCLKCSYLDYIAFHLVSSCTPVSNCMLDNCTDCLKCSYLDYIAFHLVSSCTPVSNCMLDNCTDCLKCSYLDYIAFHLVSSCTPVSNCMLDNCTDCLKCSYLDYIAFHLVSSCTPVSNCTLDNCTTCIEHALRALYGCNICWKCSYLWIHCISPRLFLYTCIKLHTIFAESVLTYEYIAFLLVSSCTPASNCTQYLLKVFLPMNTLHFTSSFLVRLYQTACWITVLIVKKVFSLWNINQNVLEGLQGTKSKIFTICYFLYYSPLYKKTNSAATDWEKYHNSARILVLFFTCLSFWSTWFTLIRREQSLREYVARPRFKLTTPYSSI